MDGDNMIDFSCVYCGRAFRVQDIYASKKARCPACRHAIRIPPKPAPTSDDYNNSPKADAESWAGKTDKEIARLLRTRKTMQAIETELLLPLKARLQAHIATKRLLKPLLPRYDDLTLFALSAAFLLLFLANFNASGERISIRNGEVHMNYPMSMFVEFSTLSVLAGIGLILSLGSVFFTWDKPKPVKLLMLFFAVLATGGTGVIAGLVTLKTAHGWLMMIFPVWNIVNGATLLVLFRAGMMDADCIVDRKPNLWQVAVTFTLIALIFAVCQYGFKLHWAITYSICVCYTMSLNHALGDLFGMRPEPLKDQAASGN